MAFLVSVNAHQDDTSGWSPDRFVGKVGEDMTCSICLGIARNPSCTPCEHYFCHSCILRWLEVEARCPGCNQGVHPGDVVPFSNLPRFVRNAFNNLIIRCQFEADGCDTVTTIKAIEFHEAACEHRRVTCPHFACDKVLPSGLMADHSRSCEYREVPCPYNCGAVVRCAQMDLHTQACGHRPLRCTHVGCAEVTRVIQMDIHRQACYWRPVECPNAARGCDANVVAGTAASHADACVYVEETCPFPGCGATMAAIEMPAHTADCERRVEPCASGCGAAVRVAAADRHNCVAAMRVLLDEAVAAVSGLQSRVHDLESVVEAQATEIRQLREVTSLNSRRVDGTFDLLAGSVQATGSGAALGREAGHANGRSQGSGTDVAWDDDVWAVIVNDDRPERSSSRAATSSSGNGGSGATLIDLAESASNREREEAPLIPWIPATRAAPFPGFGRESDSPLPVWYAHDGSWGDDFEPLSVPDSGAAARSTSSSVSSYGRVPALDPASDDEEPVEVLADEDPFAMDGSHRIDNTNDIDGPGGPLAVVASDDQFALIPSTLTEVFGTPCGSAESNIEPISLEALRPGVASESATARAGFLMGDGTLDLTSASEGHAGRLFPIV